MEYRFAEFRLNLARAELAGPDGPVALRRQTFRLLEALLRHAPALVDRDQLIDEVWGRSALSRNALPQAISELRQALNDDPAAPRLIETRHRRGYRFIAPVERGLPAPPSTETRLDLSGEDETAISRSWSSRTRGPALAGALGLALLLVLGILTRWGSAQDDNLALTQARLLEAVEAARREGQPERAVAALRALLEMEPDHAERRMDLVEAELAALRGTGARTALAGLDPGLNSPRALRLRARIERLEGHLERALELAEAAVAAAHAQSDPDELLAAVQEQLGILRAAGQLAVADERIAAVLEQSQFDLPDHGRELLVIERAALLRERGLLTQARDTAQGLAELDPLSEPALRQGLELALIDSEAGDHAAALERLASLHPEASARVALGLALNNAWGTVLARSGDYASALQRFNAGFAEANRQGAGLQRAGLQVNAGLLFARQRRMEEAESLWLEALHTFEALGDERGQGVVLGNLAAAASARGQQARSEELNLRALTLFRRLELDGPRARTAFNLGLTRARAGAFEQADQLFAEAAAAYLAAGHQDAWLQVLAGRIELLLELGEFPLLKDLQQTANGVDSVSDEALARFKAAAGRVSQRQGDLPRARALQLQARELREQAALERWAAQSSLDLLRLDFMTGRDPVEIALAAQQLAGRFLRWDEARPEAQAAILLAEALLTQGRREEAGVALAQARKAVDRFPERLVELELSWVEAWAAHPHEFQPRIKSLLDQVRELGLAGTEQRYVRWLNGALAAAQPQSGPAFSWWVPPYVHSRPDAGQALLSADTN